MPPPLGEASPRFRGYTDMSLEAQNTRFSELVAAGAVAGLLAHICFLLLFYVVDATALVFFNIGSILLFGLCITLARHEREHLAILLIQAEVISHAAVAVWFLSWDSGFHYYIFCLLPLTLVMPYGGLGLRVVFLAFCGALYLALDYSANLMAPLIPLDDAVLDTLRRFNVIGSLTILGYLILFLRNVLVDSEKRLVRMASTDPLSGLYNRRRGFELIGQELSRTRRCGSYLSFAIADIDNFKAINDRYGHQAGDRIIVAVSETLRGAVRAHDSVVRWGGEEFLVVLPETDGATAHTVAERVRASVAAGTIRVGELALQVTVTVGIGEYVPGEPIEGALGRADAALYEGKRGGRNQVVVGALRRAVNA
jgi:diguanylate cyclase (GGDEF)-like protein